MTTATLSKEMLFDYVIVDDIKIEQGMLKEAQNHDSNLLDETDHSKETNSNLSEATDDNAHSQMRLGYMYQCGEGVLVNYKLAMEWYLKAHNNGNTNATNNIGYMYGHGQGVTADDKLALRWYLEAANKGNSYAQNNVGSAYENGIGVNKDEQYALKWYEKSAGQGIEKAKNSVVRLNKQGIYLSEKNDSTEQKLKIDLLENEWMLSSKNLLESGQEKNEIIFMSSHNKEETKSAMGEGKVGLFERLLSMVMIGKDKSGHYTMYYG